MTTGALIFWLGSWTFVIGLVSWAYTRVLRSQAQRAATPDPADDMSLSERFPPTA
jgi:hypothetical protein